MLLAKPPSPVAFVSPFPDPEKLTGVVESDVVMEGDDVDEAGPAGGGAAQTKVAFGTSTVGRKVVVAVHAK